MAQVDATRVPWSFRLFAGFPLPPVAVGVLLGAALLGTFLGLQAATGHPAELLGDGLSSRVSRGLAVLLMMLAYVPTAHFYLARWTQRHLEALSPMLRRPLASTRPEALRGSAAGRVAGAAGALLFVAMFLVVPVSLDESFDVEGWTLENTLPWLAVPLLGWLMARFAQALVVDARAVSDAAGDLERIDLLDLTPLAPFVQQGLAGALLVILLLALGMGGIVGQDVVLPSAATTVAVMLNIGIAALVMPVLGVRRRIRAEKRAQLAELRRSIDADRAAVLSGAASLDRVAARLPGLLALEERLERVREWPFDVSSLLRFAFYLLLGLGSWLGAAFVERLLDVFLG